jgi:hypothetical protein
MNAKTAVLFLTGEEPGYQLTRSDLGRVEGNFLVQQVAAGLESDARLSGFQQPLDRALIAVRTSAPCGQ